MPRRTIGRTRDTDALYKEITGRDFNRAPRLACGHVATERDGGGWFCVECEPNPTQEGNTDA